MVNKASTRGLGSPLMRVVKLYGLPVLWACFAVLILVNGGRPDGYFLRDFPAEQWQYPVKGVLIALAFSVGELALMTLILRPMSYSRSWKRALIAAIMFCVLFVMCALTLMHMPHYVVAHALWVLSLFVTSVVILGVSFVAAMRGTRKA